MSPSLRNPAHQQNEQVSIILTAKVAEELRRLQARTGLSQADIINRAVTLYDFVDEQLSRGNQLVIRDAAGKDSEVRIR